MGQVLWHGIDFSWPVQQRLLPHEFLLLLCEFEEFVGPILRLVSNPGLPIRSLLVRQAPVPGLIEAGCDAGLPLLQRHC